MAGITKLELNIERLNETEEVLFAETDIDVIISYYWDSHGELIDWKGPNGDSVDKIHAETVKIISKEWDDKIGDSITHGESWDIIIDGKQINADVNSYEMRRNKLYIDAIVGWG